MSQKYKCNYCKKYFDDLYCLDNPEREICEECLAKHPRLKTKWENQHEQFIKGIQGFTKAAESIVLNIDKAMRVFAKSLADSESIKKNLNVF